MSTDPLAKQKALLVKVENNKIILSSREHASAEPKLKVVAKRGVDVRKTPEPDQSVSHNQLQDRTEQDTTKKNGKKLELSNRHRRSFSDGNDHAAQFKFMQVQKQMLEKKTGILH